MIWRRVPKVDLAVDLHPWMTFGVVKGTSPCARASVGIANEAKTAAANTPLDFVRASFAFMLLSSENAVISKRSVRRRIDATSEASSVGRLARNGGASITSGGGAFFQPVMREAATGSVILVLEFVAFQFRYA
jgi:hypothetical protein